MLSTKSKEINELKFTIQKQKKEIWSLNMAIDALQLELIQTRYELFKKQKLNCQYVRKTTKAIRKENNKLCPKFNSDFKYYQNALNKNNTYWFHNQLDEKE